MSGAGGAPEAGASGAPASAGSGGSAGQAAGAAGADSPQAGAAGRPDVGTEGDGTFDIGKPFSASPDVSDHAGVGKGQVTAFTLSNSKTFNDGSRKVSVYVPAGYVSGSEVPFIVAQDGVSPQGGESFGLDDLRPILDNLRAAGRLPAIAGIFVDPGSARSVEYDTVSDKYHQFVETELLPAAIAQVQMKTGATLNLTHDPEGRCAFGGSSGGSAAFTMAWLHPESYRRVLTLSGSFVSLKQSADYPDGAAGYWKTLIPNQPVLPLRVFLESGSNDLPGKVSWRAANDAMAKVLAERGYHYRYVRAEGAGHEDSAARRQYLPQALEWLWRGYPMN